MSANRYSYVESKNWSYSFQQTNKHPKIAWILRRVLEIKEIYYHSNSTYKPISYCCCEKLVNNKHQSIVYNLKTLSKGTKMICKGNRRTNDLLRIEPQILKEARTWRENSHGRDRLQRRDSASIDNRNSKMFKISEKVLIFISRAMESWRIELSVAEQTLAEVQIQRVIFLERLICASIICYRNDTTKWYTAGIKGSYRFTSCSCY